MLAQLRKSMKRDTDSELKKLDQLEMEIKSRGAVEETVTATQRNRMDSGAFLEHATATGASTASSAAGSATTTTAH